MKLSFSDRKWSEYTFAELIDAADYDIGIRLLGIDAVQGKSLAVGLEIVQSHLSDLISCKFIGHINHLAAILLDKQKKIK